MGLFFALSDKKNLDGTWWWFYTLLVATEAPARRQGGVQGWCEGSMNRMTLQGGGVMSVRRRRLFTPYLVTVLLAALAVAGCRSGYSCASRCTPRGPWQSPSIQAVRALLLVNTQELEIQRLDRKRARPACTGRDDVREYHLSPGAHSVRATFCYDTPPSEGLLGEVQGLPLTVEHEFLAGHEYVAVYREHPYPKPFEGVGEVASNVRESDERYYWTLEIVDLTEATLRTEPEVEEARLYCAWIKGLASAAH